MPLENLEEEGLPKNPDLRIGQLCFLLCLPEHRGDAAVREELMAAIGDNNMAPYYEALCKMDMDLLNYMKKANEEKLKHLDEELQDAEKNLGESETRDAMMAKPEYLCRIGDKMDASCAHWKSIIDHLLTHEKTMFKDLMNMQSSSLKLFSSFEQKAMLLKHQAFAVFSGELDQ
ncbi:26S proteasome non-ATPase regulatory subunit 6 [Sciurus carolinensis]|uniref:26S proteasome non-ATPase regulatory subunit 6 n=1 Tax=Sciurus carolinensis TaxID=30640 RepID=A0AA41MLT5_SCICA|nr:26S proteasome non-ATPase regulatory subunit 6 [Sciurus carolinensis]